MRPFKKHGLDAPHEAAARHLLQPLGFNMSPEKQQYIQRIETALFTCTEKRKESPSFLPLELAEEQLTFLRNYWLGKEKNENLLSNINVGLLAVREFEMRDMKFAEQIYEALDAHDYLLKMQKT